MKRYFKAMYLFFRYHFKLVRHVKWRILISYGLSFLEGVVPSLNTVLLAYAVTQLSDRIQLGGALILALIGIGFTSAVQDVLRELQGYCILKMRTIAELPIHMEFHDICCSLDYRYREKREANDLMERASTAVQRSQIEMTLRSIPALIQCLLLFILPCVLLWRFGWYLPLIGAAFAVAFCAFSYRANREMNIFYNMSSTENRFILTYTEQLYDKNSFRELKAYNKRGWLREKWERSFDVYRKKTYRQEIRYQLLWKLSPLIIAFSMLVLIAVFLLVNRGRQYGDASAMVVTVINACTALCNAAVGLQGQFFTISGLGETLINYSTLEKHSQPNRRQENRDMQPVEVELNDVHFSYDDETEALSGVTLDIRPGEKLAIVGENGSGKTTLAKLILSLYKPTSGTLTLSNASGVLPQACASAVMQEYVRYLLSVRENIGFGDPEKLTDDAALTAAYESVTGEPLFDALDAQLGAKFGGHELSGGQWQRLALARAYLKEAPLIVLDEPNASIDAFAEAAMIKRMFEMAKDKTCVFITHRLTTTALADRIIVMKDGRICEEGTHEELMRRNGEYARMYSVQAEMYA